MVQAVNNYADKLKTWTLRPERALDERRSRPAFRHPGAALLPNLGISNREYAAVEPLATHRKQTTATHSNRQFLHGWIFRRISPAAARHRVRDGSPLLPDQAIRPLVSRNRRGGDWQSRWRRILGDSCGLLWRQWRHPGQRMVAHRGEFVPVAFGYWIGRRQRQALEIQEFLAALDAEIQVRAGGQSGHTNQTNPLALLDALAGMYQNARQVHVI